MAEPLNEIQETTVYAVGHRLQHGELVLQSTLEDLVDQQPNLFRLLKTWVEQNDLPEETQKWVYAGAVLVYKTIEAQQAAPDLERDVNG